MTTPRRARPSAGSPGPTLRKNNTMNARRGVIAAAFLAAIAVSPPAQGQSGNSRVFGDLLKRIPEHSDVLMLVNVDGLFNSPMGRRENWRQEALANRPRGLG